MTRESERAGQESIVGVAARIEAWIGLGAAGIVWIRHASDVSRDLLLSQLSSKRSIQRIGFRPPKPNQAANWLEGELSKAVAADSLPVVAVLFPPSIVGTPGNGDSPTDLAWEFRSLNLRRELLARMPLIQLWCVPLSVARTAELEAPDLASWFQLKFTLAEVVETPSSLADQFITPRPERESQTVEELSEAVQRQRRLVQSGGETHLRQLGAALGNLGVKLADEGREEEALERAEEAVGIFRQLEQTLPGAFLMDLAISLNNLALWLNAVGRLEEALKQAEEAVRIYRQLAQSGLYAFLPNLAGSLGNLANVLRNMGRTQEALERTEQAARIYQQLAQARPDAFQPDLAGSLINLAIGLRFVGRREEALERVEEAVRIYRQLAEARPDAFLPDFARSLAVAGNIILESAGSQAKDGDYQVSGAVRGAMERLAEAIRILTPFFTRLPQAHGPLMQTLLNWYAQAAEAAEVEMDSGLIAPVVEVLEHLKPENQSPG